MSDMKWEDHIIMMAKHKMLEKLEHLNKEDRHNMLEVECYKNAAEALRHLCEVAKQMKQP